MDDRGGQGVGWSRLFGWGLAVLALWFVFRWLRGVDPLVWQQFQSLEVTSVLISFVLFQGWFVLRYLGWEFISRRYGLDSQRASNLRMWTLSELMRYIPGNVWSFAARYRGAKERGTGRRGAAVSLVVEASNLVAGAALVAAVFWRPEWWLLWLLAAGVFVTIWPWLVRRLASWRKWEFPKPLSYRDSVVLLGVYLAVWLLYGLAQAIIILSIPGLSTPGLTFLLGINVTAWLIGYVSVITPMGLGVREVAFVTLLKNTIAPGVGSMLAVLTRVWLVVCELAFLGLVTIFTSRRPGSLE
ncbi:MAG: flippase-like domain-containing protein [Candidatus Kerfeldbacteria bacterium]|nr:flippase-like domain-containing protein [Candidatus Kerfeldbacteria bacterium]